MLSAQSANHINGYNSVVTETLLYLFFVKYIPRGDIDMKEDREFVPEENLMKPKKPIYKRPWFWILMVVILAGVAGSSGGDKEKPKKESITKETSKKEPTKKEPVVSKDLPATDTPTEKPVVEDAKVTMGADGVDPKLKEFLAAYESFIDEYVVFMKKYMENPANVLAMLDEYTKIMQKSDEFSAKMEKYDTKTMSAADAKYYLEVYNRCSQKMLSVYSK